jgi:hypothetical protein
MVNVTRRRGLKDKRVDIDRKGFPDARYMIVEGHRYKHSESVVERWVVGRSRPKERRGREAWHSTSISDT